MVKRKIEDETPKRKVEGYMDYKRNVFVVTADPEGVLSPSYNSQEKGDSAVNDVRDYLKKYKPNF